MLKTGPTGKLVRGHVLDVAKHGLERMLKDYDPQLYVKWNPKKLNGWGVWEVRRRPSMKVVSDIVEFQGASYVRIDWFENDIESHILDVPYLNYDVLTKLKSMDMWNQNQQYFVDMLESREASHRANEEAKNRADMQYRAKQYKNEFRAFKEAVCSGLNPAEIANYWNKVGS